MTKVLMHMSVENSETWPLNQNQRILQGRVLCDYTVSHCGCSSICHYNNNIHRTKGTIMYMRKMKRRFIVFMQITVCSWKDGLRT